MNESVYSILSTVQCYRFTGCIRIPPNENKSIVEKLLLLSVTDPLEPSCSPA